MGEDVPKSGPRGIHGYRKARNDFRRDCPPRRVFIYSSLSTAAASVNLDGNSSRTRVTFKSDYVETSSSNSYDSRIKARRRQRRNVDLDLTRRRSPLARKSRSAAPQVPQEVFLRYVRRLYRSEAEEKAETACLPRLLARPRTPPLPSPPTLSSLSALLPLPAPFPKPSIISAPYNMVRL